MAYPIYLKENGVIVFQKTFATELERTNYINSLQDKFTYEIESAGVSTFLGLSDTPNSFGSQRNKFVKVNAGEDALEFAALAGGGDMLASVYDPDGVGDDAFDMDNMIDGATYVKTENNLTDALVSTIGSALQSETSHADVLVEGDIGSTVQGYNANTVIDASYVHTDVNFTSAKDSKLAGIEAGAQVNPDLSGLNTKFTIYQMIDDVATTGDVNSMVFINLIGSLGEITLNIADPTADGTMCIINLMSIASGSSVVIRINDVVYTTLDDTTTVFNLILTYCGDQGGWVFNNVYPEDIPVVSDVAYDATTWDNNLDAPTKNAIRDKFEGLTVGGAVPIGGIIMWSGSIATIPANWYLCNGSNSTPDLRDKFIVGATADDAGVAKTNIAGSLSQTGGATGHSHSGHAALSHSGFSITDHTGLTHGLTIANHPDLTHVALASHPALTIEGQTHANVTLPGYTHPVLTIEGMTHAVQSIASRNDAVGAAMTHADLSFDSRSIVNAAIAGKASFASGTNRSGMTSVPTHSGTMAASTYTIVSHPTHSVTIPAWSISPASHPTFTASAVASHPTVTVAVASHPTMTASGLTHGGVGTHVGTDYGVHSITAPAGHGTAGTVTHSFSESSAHSVSAHDTVSQLPSYYALAFIMRYQ